MNTIKEYVEKITIIYKDQLAVVVDMDNNFHFISNRLSALLGTNELGQLTNLDDIEICSKNSKDNIKKLNKYILEKKQIVRFISMGKLLNGQFYIFRGIKYPILDRSKKPIGIFSLMNLASAIHIEPQATLLLHEIVFDLNNTKLTELDKLILFYASIGFTQSEIYQSIIKLGKDLTFNGFKYYYNQLLIKTNTRSINEVINSISALKNKTFIPKTLIEARNDHILF